MRPRRFERALLDFASRSDVEINPATIAHHFDITMAEARFQLDRLAKMGVLEINSAETGRIYYNLPGREEMVPRQETPWNPKRAVLAAAVVWGALAAGALGVALFANEPAPPPPPAAFTFSASARSSLPQKGREEGERAFAPEPVSQPSHALSLEVFSSASEQSELTLITRPYGAAVYEGPDFLGFTPLTLHRSDQAPHVYKIVKPGHQSRLIHVAGGGRHIYELELSRSLLPWGIGERILPNVVFVH